MIQSVPWLVYMFFRDVVSLDADPVQLTGWIQWGLRRDVDMQSLRPRVKEVGEGLNIARGIIVDFLRLKSRPLCTCEFNSDSCAMIYIACIHNYPSYWVARWSWINRLTCTWVRRGTRTNILVAIGVLHQYWYPESFFLKWFCLDVVFRLHTYTYTYGPSDI